MLRYSSFYLIVIGLLSLTQVYQSQPPKYQESVEYLEWNADGKLIAFAIGNTIEIVDTLKNTVIYTEQFFEDILDLAWHPVDPYLLAIASAPANIVLTDLIFVLDVQSSNILHTLEAQTDVRGIGWSPDGTFLAIGGNTEQLDPTWLQNKFVLWDHQTEILQPIYIGQSLDLITFVWSTSSQIASIYVSNTETMLIISDIALEEPLQQYTVVATEGTFDNLSLNPDGTQIALGVRT
ncbi:MAG: WD40 repeat domain-containing protein [Anaerolineae bacterium]|nr:WD40 repeat domain-containing protein [Anaerolineae bacterium]